MLDNLDIVAARGASVFQAARQRAILLALIPTERSLSELARLTGTPLNLLHYHIGKFVALGLVTIAREEARAGTPIKYYRAAARAFFVPAALMHAVPGAALTVKMRETLDRHLAGSLKGFVYSNDGTRPTMRAIKEPSTGPIAVELWLELRLGKKDAAELADELRTLLGRYKERSTVKDRSYLIHAAIAPA